MKKFAIYAVLILAFLLRFVFIGKFPVGFNADEASFGYDAYSILKTGKDQWGNTLPLVFKSFGDYKSPVYGYLTLPSIAIFGLNVFATRLPNVFVGTLAVFAVYLLVGEISNFLNISEKWIKDYLKILAALFLAVNPWSVMMGRGAFEANLITFFLPMGIYFFLRGLKEDRFFLWSSLFLGINLFTYHSAKLITPLVVLGLVFIFWNRLKKIGIKKMAPSILIFVIFFSGLVYTSFTGGSDRIAERSITQGALEQGFQERMKAIDEGLNPKIGKLLHNRYQVIFSRFVFNYFQYSSSRFLIQKGAGDASYGMTPGIGVVNATEVVFALGIILFFFKSKKDRKLIAAVILWLLISILPAAMATGIGYSGNRAEGMIPVMQIIESLGAIGWYLVLKDVDIKFLNSNIKRIIVFILGMFFVFNVYSFINNYFRIPDNLFLRQQIYGSLEAATWLSENGNSRNIVVSRSLTEPQIFVAFAIKIDPNEFQKSTKDWGFDESNLSWVDQLPSYKVGNYTFKSLEKKDFSDDNLVVIRSEEFDGKEIPIKIIRYPNGEPCIYILDMGQKAYAKIN